MNLPPTLPILLLLPHDLVLEIPREEQQVIGHRRLQQLGGIVHAEVHARHGFALFMRASIHHVIEQPGVDAGGIQKNRPLG